MPEDEKQMNQVRNSLLRMEPTYTVELVWIMTKYGGCNRSAIEALLNTRAIQQHLSWHMDRAAELMARQPPSLTHRAAFDNRVAPLTISRQSCTVCPLRVDIPRHKPTLPMSPSARPGASASWTRSTTRSLTIKSSWTSSQPTASRATALPAL